MARNEVETRIIPSTWREGGVGVMGTTELGPTWEAGITTGFDLEKFDDASSPLSSVHQELQLAKAKDLSYYAALNYKESGFLMGSSLFMGNSLQGNAAYIADNTQPNFSGITGLITLWDIHTRWQNQGWDIQALYANGSIGEADKINAAIQTYNGTASEARSYVPSGFYGWLVQSAYTVWRSEGMSLSPFVRYEAFDTQASMPSGFSSEAKNADQVLTIGVSFKPHSDVVFKADYQTYSVNSNSTRLNLGMGYLF